MYTSLHTQVLTLRVHAVGQKTLATSSKYKIVVGASKPLQNMF